MSREQLHSEVPISGKSDLIDYLQVGCKTADGRGIGTEHEKFGVLADTLEPITYDGQRGLERVFELLVERHAWTPEYDKGRAMALVKDGAAITLEPGGQLELSGRVLRTIHETADELDAHLREVREIGDELGILWLGAGCHPVAAVDEIGWVPKSRYGRMKPFLEQRGRLAHHMMKATCTVQANFDYTSEADFGEIVHLGARISPVISAIFANSSVVAGNDSGDATFRCRIWTETDPDRCGTPAFMLEGPVLFERWVDYVLDIPVMFIRRDGGYVDMAGRTFRQFVEGGHQGHAATIGDWEIHLSTVFPDLRTKQFVEVRGADAGDRAAILALPALWKGLLYDTEARAAADALIGPVSPEDHARWQLEMCKRGLRAQRDETPVVDLARALVSIATESLDRATLSGQPSESVYLEPIARIVRTGTTAADETRRLWRDSGGDKRRLVEHLLV